MRPSRYSCLHALGLALAFQHVALAQDAKCYYPNGSEAPDTEKPCSSAEGSACCPEKWQCLDNGLCYYPNDDLHGRYSCTDKSWKSPGCPSNMCTYDMKAVGGEDIRQCSNHNNDWCCNANNQDVKCCDGWPEPRPFFQLADGKQYALAGSSQASDAPDLASITGLATGSGGGSAPSSTPPPSSNSPSSGTPTSSTDDSSPSSSGGSPTPTGPTTPITSAVTRVTSDSTGGIRTSIQTIISTPLPASTTDPSAGSASSPSSSSSKTAVIVGCAVGIPLALALAGIIFWLLRKRRNQKANGYSETPEPYADPNSPEFKGGARLSKPQGAGAIKYRADSQPGVPELPAQSVGPERPISTLKGRAELESGTAFVPGTTPHAPHLVGVGGGNGNGTGHTPQSSWGSAPPGYSPGMNQQNWAPGHTQPEMQDARGAGAGAAGAQTEGGRYIPYRPPPGHGAGLDNVPEMAELSAVPPDVHEMGGGRTP